MFGLVAGLLMSAQFASGADEGGMTNRLIIKFRNPGDVAASTAEDRVARISALGREVGVTLRYRREMFGQQQLVELPEGTKAETVSEIARLLSGRDDIAYATPDRIRTIRAQPNDPRFTEQWHLRSVLPTEYGANVEAAWDVTTGSPDLVIAIVDTGMLTDHPDFGGRILPGFDFVSDLTAANDGDARDADPNDPGDWTAEGECPAAESGAAKRAEASSSSWHGTHVGGVAAATGNNGEGVAGVNWVSRILPVRVLGKCGGSDSDNIDGTAWAAGLPVPGVPDNPSPARVINMSFGGPGECSPAWQDVLDQIWARGAIPVTAAGNDASTTPSSPGNCQHIINVGASGPSGDRSTFSDHHAMVDIMAPGGDGDRCGETCQILSTLDAGQQGPEGRTYGWQQGTSQAAPVVAGVISLMLSVNPGLSPDQVEQILKSTATPFPTASCTPDVCGAGIVNAAAAVAAAQNGQ